MPMSSFVADNSFRSINCSIPKWEVGVKRLTPLRTVGTAAASPVLPGSRPDRLGGTVESAGISGTVGNVERVAVSVVGGHARRYLEPTQADGEEIMTIPIVEDWKAIHD